MMFGLRMCLSLWLPDVMEGKTAILLEMSQWNSNDLVEQIETLGHLERSRGTYLTHLTYSFSQQISISSLKPTLSNILGRVPAPVLAKKLVW